MKMIGLIGGMSWTSTITYYQLINSYVANKMGGLHSAKILLSSVDFSDLEKLQRGGMWHEAGRLILIEAIRLQDAGCDFVVICSNTGNECVARVKDRLKIPIIHIADALGKELRLLGYSKIGLLGTIYTMEREYIKNILENDYGIDIAIPNKEDRIKINKIIYSELCIDKITNESKQIYIDIVKKLINRNIDAVVLGCTEIGLLIKQSDFNTPILDTTIIHSNCAANLAIN